MSRLLSVAAGLLIVPVVALTGVANATSVKSYIEGDFKVKNVTDGTSYMDPASADKCETVSYRARLHNPGPDQVLTNVTVQVSVPQGTSTKNVATAILRAENASPSNTSDTATLDLSSAQKLSYVNGTTQLLNSKGEVIKTLPDGITGAGVNIGTLGISLNEIKYVRFEMKVSCPEVPTPTPTPTPTPKPQVKGEVSKKPEALPNAGAGQVISLFAGASAAGAAAHYAVRRFRG
jgi:hypothetical protein